MARQVTVNVLWLMSRLFEAATVQISRTESGCNHVAPRTEEERD